MSVDRNKFRSSGIYYEDVGKHFYWKDSYQEGEKVQFVTSSRTNWKCDECRIKFVSGDLISLGTRQFYPDAPISVDGTDRVHLKCYVGAKNFHTYISDGKGTWMDKVTEIDGYGSLDLNHKKKWLKWQNMKINSVNLNSGDLPTLSRKVFVVIGLFDDKDEVRNLIVKNGGGLQNTYTRSVTHCVLGRSGRTKYGAKTGQGSKIYEKLIKKKIPIVSLDELHGLITHVKIQQNKRMKKRIDLNKNKSKKRTLTEFNDYHDKLKEPPTKKQKKVNLVARILTFSCVVMLSSFVPFILLIVGCVSADNSATITINTGNSKNIEDVPDIYWQSCGFTPASDILNPNGTENMWWVGRIPRYGIHYVRIHYLIDLLSVIGIKSNESLIYNWTNLDKAMDILRSNNRFPIFELMGNPSMFFDNFYNNTQLYIWKDLVSQIAQRYINKYGTSVVYKWLFETWNEPPHWTENFEWNDTSWSNYYDACNNGLLSIDKNLKFGGPSGGKIDYFYYCLNHVTNGTDYFTSKTGNIRIDFLSQHNKGNEDEYTVLYKDLTTENIIISNYPSLINRSILFNDEGDPKVGWAQHYKWRATPSYAALEVQGFNLHFQNFNTIYSTYNRSRIPFGLLSNDNCFMGDASFQERTVNARFNNTKNNEFEFIPKSGLQIMSLLSLHGNKMINQNSIKIKGIAKDSIQVLTFMNQSNELCEILVILYTSNTSMNQNNTQTTIDLMVNITDLNVNYYDSIIAKWNLDYKYGNPYATWKSFNSPSLPTMKQVIEMREDSHPKLTINNAGGLIGESTLYGPGVSIIHFIYAIGNGNKWNNPPPKVMNVKIYKKNSIYSFINNNENAYYISWDSVSSHIISTFVVMYSETANGIYSSISNESFILDGYVFITNQTNGFIKVGAIDYWGLAGPLSDYVDIQTVNTV